MKCPVCNAKNSPEASACAGCGRSLRGREARPARRAASRRPNGEAAEAAALDSNNPAAWRAYRVSLWSLVPGLGLILGPVATMLGCRAVHSVGDDFSASNRAKAAIVLGAASTFTQWLGVTLIYFSRS
jgi:hypothetical protein